MPCRQRHALVFVAAFLPPLFTSGSPAVAQVLAQNLIYTSMQPCRLFDTRVAGGALVANTNRQFDAVGVSSAGSLSSQGGNANGCPIPGFGVSSAPQVQAIVVNLTVVTPSGREPGRYRRQQHDSQGRSAPQRALLDGQRHDAQRGAEAARQDRGAVDATG
jgi:hypothetical protein